MLIKLRNEPKDSQVADSKRPTLISSPTLTTPLVREGIPRNTRLRKLRNEPSASKPYLQVIDSKRNETAESLPHPTPSPSPCVKVMLVGGTHPQFANRWLTGTHRPRSSFARNFAIRPINFTGTGSDRGKRIVPFSILYGASSSRNAATTCLVAAYIE
jgi:hypothetical protein